MKRFVAGFLTLVLILLLTACGRQGTEPDDKATPPVPEQTAQTEAPETASTPEPGTVADASSAMGNAGLVITAPEGELVAGFMARNGRYYLTTTRDDGEDIPETAAGNPVMGTAEAVYEVDILQGTLTPLAARLPVLGGQADVISFILEPDGSQWVYTTEITFPDGEEAPPEQTFLLTHYDAEGTRLGQVDVAQLTGSENRSLGQLESWGDGGLLALVEGDGGVCTIQTLDYAGNVTATMDAPGRPMDLAVLEDGAVLLTSFVEQRYSLFTVDVQAGTVTALPLENAEDTEDGFFGDILCGDGDAVWFDDHSDLYRYDRASGTLEKQMAWVDIGVTSLAGAFPRDGGLWIAEYGDGLRSIRLSPVRLDGDERQVLTLGCFYSDLNTSLAVAKFNRENSQYRIELRDYGNFEAEPLTRFLNDVISGDVPDMLSLYELPYDSLRELGLLADLTEYIDADPDIRREDYLPAMWDAVTVDGQVLSVVTGFIVGTYWGFEGDVSREQFTLEKFEAMCQEERPMFQRGDSPEVRANSMLDEVAANFSQFVDLQAGTCSFDSAAFRDLLRAEKDMTIAGYEQTDDARLTKVGISDYLFWLDQTVPLGFPTAEGGQCSFDPRVEYAITTKCAAPDACWQFIRQFLLAEFDPNTWDHWMPVKYSSLEALADAYLSPPDAEVTQQDVDTVNALLEMPMYVYRFASFQDEILSIVSEELTPYFAGAADMDTVISNLQGRVGLYLSEHQ